MASNLKRSSSSIICFVCMKEHSGDFSFSKGCSISKMYVTFLYLSHTKQNVKRQCVKQRKLKSRGTFFFISFMASIKMITTSISLYEIYKGGLFQCRFCVRLSLLLYFYNYVIESIREYFQYISSILGKQSQPWQERRKDEQVGHQGFLWQ